MTAPTPPREIVIPFGVDAFGRIAFSTDPYEQLSSHIQMLVGTQVRQRLMDPAYGVDTMGFLFQPITDQVQSTLELAVEQAIKDYEPLIEVVSIQPLTDEANGLLGVEVNFSLVTQAQQQSTGQAVYTATIDLGGTVVAQRS